MKDTEAGEEGFFAEVGKGVLDFEKILDAAEEAGTEWPIVEQDRCRRSSFDCIRTSFRNLKKMGVMA